MAEDTEAVRVMLVSRGVGGYGGGYRGFGYGGYGYGYGLGGFGLGIGLGLGYGLGYGYGYGYGYPGYGYGYGGYGYGYPGYGYGYPGYYDPSYGPAPSNYPPPGAPQPGAQPGPTGGWTGVPTSNRIDTNATVGVRVPADATVWINGAKTNQGGTSRQFMSTGLEPGRTYTYTIRAQWKGTDGQPVDLDQSIVVQAGEKRWVNFANPISPRAKITPAVVSGVSP